MDRGSRGGTAPRGAVVAGVDLGGTSAKIGIVDRAGSILARDRVAIDARAPFDDILAPVAAAIAGLLGKRDGDRDLAGIGFGAPGFFDPASGAIVGGSENLPGMARRSAPAFLSARLGAPAWADNDATCAAAAELAYGAGRGLAGFVLVTVGTGIGGGLVLGGRVWRGARGFAGEIGHLSLDPEGPSCPCGARGCLEQYAAAPAIVRAWMAATGASGTGEESPQEIARRARGGDAAALSAFASAGRALGQAFGGVANLLDVEAFLVGGGVADAGEVLLAPVREAFRRFAYPLVADGVRIERAALGNDAGLLGAAALAWERLGGR